MNIEVHASARRVMTGGMTGRYSNETGIALTDREKNRQ